MRDMTNFTDKTGRSICVGDVVHIKIPGKTDGPIINTVARKFNRIALFSAGTESDTYSKGVLLDEHIAKYLIVVEHSS